MNVNVFGTITLTRLLAPYMLDRGMGHFVVVCINFQQELLVITVSFCLLVWLTHIQMSSAAGKVPPFVLLEHFECEGNKLAVTAEVVENLGVGLC